jgi:acyl dehydratase
MSPGVENLKWLKPVYADDRIAYSGVVSARRLSRSRPGWGIVSIEFTGENQKGEPVFTMTGHVFVAV